MSLLAKLDKIALIKAMEDGTPENRYLLDRDTGQLIMLSSKTMNTTELLAFKDKMTKEPDRYVTVDKTPSEEKYQDFEAFVKETKDKKLQEKLLMILKGGNPARPFLDAIDAHPIEKEHWKQFKLKRVLKRMEAFLKENGLT